MGYGNRVYRFGNYVDPDAIKYAQTIAVREIHVQKLHGIDDVIVDVMFTNFAVADIVFIDMRSAMKWVNEIATRDGLRTTPSFYNFQQIWF